MTQGVNVIALVKDAERYIFLYDDDSAPVVLQTMGRFASDPELSFSWYDAAVLSQKVRKLKREQVESERADAASGETNFTKAKPGPAPHYPGLAKRKAIDEALE
jgi:hypothetical protein